MVNYERELRIGVDLRRKGKIEKVMEFTERIRRVQKEVETALKKTQEKIKKQADEERKKAEVWKVGDRMILNIKDIVFKKRLIKKLVD